MSFATKALPFAIAALVAACSDVSSPKQIARSGSASTSKGSGGGTSGGGSGGGSTSGSTTQLVVTTPPSANVTGTWLGTSDGPDVTHNYRFVLSQTTAGIVSGQGTTTTPFTTVQESVVGTVNGDTLMLYVGTLSCSCTLSPLYRGIVSPAGSQIDGSFLNGGVSPVTLFKQ